MADRVTARSEPAPGRGDLALVCDAYGLPHSAIALDRHLTGNAALTIETWKLVAAQWEERALRAERALSAVGDPPGQPS